MKYRILAADIGGTNSRFAGFETWKRPGGPLAPCWRLSVETKRFQSFSALLDWLSEKIDPFSWKDWDRAVFGVPGPVLGTDPVSLPNVPWRADISGLIKDHGKNRFLLINDFAAQAFSCLEPNPDLPWIRRAKPHEKCPKAVIGGGTGLGHCTLVPNFAGGYFPVPSEAGHAEFCFQGEKEKAFERFLLQRTGRPYVVGDMVVTGFGLSMLHLFMTKKEMKPENIVKELDPNSPTRVWFSRFYGRAARNFSLAVLPMGGLFISGGIAANHPSLIDNEEFFTEFENHWVYKEMLSKIPVQLQTDPDAGLKGAALYGLQSLISI